MNYFERLVRRARRRPRAGSGEVRPDPFENVEEWPLAASVAPAGPDAPTRPAGPLPVETVTRDPGTAAATPAGRTAPESVIPEVRPDPVVSVPSSAVVTTEARPEAGEALAAEAHSLTPAPPLPMPAPLDQADQFMRSLGLPLPGLPNGVPEERPVVSPAPPPLNTTPPSPPAVPRVQLVLPPPPPVPDRPAPGDAPSSTAASMPAVPARGPERESPPRIPPVVERREVIVVERTSGARREGRVGGGGAPHFGLGQL